MVGVMCKVTLHKINGVEPGPNGPHMDVEPDYDNAILLSLPGGPYLSVSGADLLRAIKVVQEAEFVPRVFHSQQTPPGTGPAAQTRDEPRETTRKPEDPCQLCGSIIGPVGEGSGYAPGLMCYGCGPANALPKPLAALREISLTTTGAAKCMAISIIKHYLGLALTRAWEKHQWRPDYY